MLFEKNKENYSKEVAEQRYEETRMKLTPDLYYWDRFELLGPGWLSAAMFMILGAARNHELPEFVLASCIEERD